MGGLEEERAREREACWWEQRECTARDERGRSGDERRGRRRAGFPRVKGVRQGENYEAQVHAGYIIKKTGNLIIFSGSRKDIKWRLYVSRVRRVCRGVVASAGTFQRPIHVRVHQ